MKLFFSIVAVLVGLGTNVNAASGLSSVVFTNLDRAVFDVDFSRPSSNVVRLVNSVGSGSTNWVDSGTTNATLAGVAFIGTDATQIESKSATGTNQIYILNEFVDTGGGNANGLIRVNNGYGRDIAHDGYNNYNIFLGVDVMDAGAGGAYTNLVDGIFIGDDVAGNAVINDCYDLVGISDASFNFSTLKSSHDLVAIGDVAINSVNFDTVDNVVGMGNQPLYQSHLTNSSYILAAGYRAGTNMTGTYNNIALWGKNAQPTLTANQQVFGDSTVANYNFPGTGTITTAGSYTSGAPSGGTAAAWKLGSLKTCSAVTMVVTNYIEVEIGGVTNAIPILRITP